MSIRIDFIDGNTASATYGDVVHQLYQPSFIKYQNSPKKISGSGYFAHEPVRVKFQVLLDTWISDHLLSDSYEHARSISWYEAKVYDDTTLIYWGIIDTSVISYDYSDDVFEITLYDRLRLLKLFEDLVHRYYWGTPLTPYNVMQQFSGRIEGQIDVDLPTSNDLTIPSLNVTGQSLATIEYSDFESLPDDTAYYDYEWYYKNHYSASLATDGHYVSPSTGALVSNTDYCASHFIPIVAGNVYHSSDNMRFVAIFDSSYNVMPPAATFPDENTNVFTAPSGSAYARVSILQTDKTAFSLHLHSRWTAAQIGFNGTSPSFAFAYMRVIEREKISDSTLTYMGRYKGRVYIYFNKICPLIYEYDEETDWVESIDELGDPLSEFYAFFAEHGINEVALFNLNAGHTSGSDTFTTAHTSGSDDVVFTGNVLPTQMKLKSGDTEVMEVSLMSLLKAMLLLYNATLLDNLGTISLANKGSFTGEPLAIDPTDITKMTKKRVAADTIDFSLLKVLQGDTTVLGEILQQYYNDLLSNKWEYSITIDDLSKYGSIDLFTKISFSGATYGMVEVQPDRVNDEINVVGWEL